MVFFTICKYVNEESFSELVLDEPELHETFKRNISRYTLSYFEVMGFVFLIGQALITEIRFSSPFFHLDPSFSETTLQMKNPLSIQVFFHL